MALSFISIFALLWMTIFALTISHATATTPLTKKEIQRMSEIDSEAAKGLPIIEKCLQMADAGKCLHQVKLPISTRFMYEHLRDVELPIPKNSKLDSVENDAKEKLLTCTQKLVGKDLLDCLSRLPYRISNLYTVILQNIPEKATKKVRNMTPQKKANFWKTTIERFFKNRRNRSFIWSSAHFPDMIDSQFRNVQEHFIPTLQTKDTREWVETERSPSIEISAQ